MHEALFSRNGLSLERLRSFAEIISAGGPTRAAKGDSTRQSQYSRQLKELEEFFGTELFIRRQGRWVLTETGRTLQSLTNDHLNALAELRAQCACEPVVLRFGAGESFLQWRFLPKLGKLCQDLPGVRFILLNRRSEDIAAGLLAGELDVGVLPPDEAPSALKTADIPQVEFRLFAPAALRGKIKGEAANWLPSVPLALLEGGSAANDALIAQADQHNQGLRIILECSSHLQAAEAVRQGVAAAVLPAEAASWFAPGRVDSHTLLCLGKATRRVVLVWNARLTRTRRPLAEAVRVLTRILK